MFCRRNYSCCSCGGYPYPTITRESGLVGPTGPTGPTGPAISSVYATVVNTEDATAVSTTALTFNSTLVNNGLTIGENSITVPTAGAYLVSFQIGKGANAVANDNVGVAINGDIDDVTEIPVTSASTNSKTVVLKLNASDAITLVPTLTSNLTISSTPGTSVTLTVAKIS